MVFAGGDQDNNTTADPIGEGTGTPVTEPWYSGDVDWGALHAQDTAGTINSISGYVGTGLVISGNVVMRTLPTATLYSDWGFGKRFTRWGFDDPVVSDTEFATNGMQFSGWWNGVTVADNEVFGFRQGAGIPAMYGTRWVARDPDDLLDELQLYIDRYGAENFDFYDLTMIVKKQWILDFCRKIEERGMKFTWQLPSGTRTEVIDDEVARALYRTGCRNLAYAPESGSQETLKRIKKQLKLDRLVQSARIAIRNKLVVRLSIIVGFPHETRKQLLETLRLVWKMAFMGVQDSSIFIYSPYPGSELFDELREEGQIGDLDEEYFRSLLCYRDFTGAKTYNRHLSAKEIARWRFFGMLSAQIIALAVRPRRIVRLVTQLFRRRSDTLLEQRLGDLFTRRQVTSASDVERA